MSKCGPWLCAAGSGVLLTLAFPPFNQSWIIWIALTPLIAAIWFAKPWTRHRWLQLFLLGWITGTFSFWGSLFWFTSVTVPGWAILPLYLGVYTGLWALFVGIICKTEDQNKGPRLDAATRIRNVGAALHNTLLNNAPWRRKAQPIPGFFTNVEDPNTSMEDSIWIHSFRNLGIAALVAAAWTGCEWLRGTLLTGFGWNSLGVALWRNIPLIQLTDITGVGGLSFLVAMVNVTLVITAKRLSIEFGRRLRKPHYDFTITMLCVALAFVYGMHWLTQPLSKTSTEITVAAVQPNIPQQEKFDLEHELAIFRKYGELTEFAIPLQPDLVIWPEAATPRPVLSDEQTWEFLQSLAKQWNGDFLLGTMHFDRTGDYNSALLLTNHGKSTQLYHKIHLVPFGEYIPFRKSFPVFVWIMGHLVPGDFKHGNEITVLKMAKRPVKIGPLICFEDTLGDLARQFVLKGAQLFVTVTNDGWFMESAGSRQHLANAVFRCAENKTPMVRAANTGVTCIIDPIGRVVDELASPNGNTFIEGVLLGKVQVPNTAKRTFYTRYGDVFALTCLGIAIFACARTAIPWMRKR